MSLINDALKRASARASAPANPDIPAGIPVLQPAPDQKRGSALPIAVLALLAVVLIAAFFLMRGRQAPEAQAKAPAQSAPAPVKSETAAPAAAPAGTLAGSLQQAAAVANKVSAQNNEGAAIAETIAATPPPQPAPQAPAPVSVAPKPAPADASFKLQAIFFRMNNPSAVINGRTLRKGETVNGAKVIDIQRNAVELEVSGARQTLSLK